MECNKEEANRAKGIAEKKMANKDFIGAKKILLKAQQLCPDLENVSQMLIVCEVHCSAESKVRGEIDWYGILQVHSTADELTIKKQYRKLALLLHPDKNKFGGAEAAFKLVVEAHRTLTDGSKRVIHDMKRGGGFRTVSGRQPAPQTNRASVIRKQPGVASSFVSSTPTQSNGFNQQPSSFSANKTFWTICTSCGIKYQYYQSIMNRALRCQSCKKPFVAYDINAHSVPTAAPWNRNGIPQQEKRATTAHFASSQCKFGTGFDAGSEGIVGGGSAASQPCSKVRFNTEFVGASNINSTDNVKVDMDSGTANDVKFEKVKLQEVNMRAQAVKPSTASRNQKRGRKLIVESSESDSDSDEVVRYNYHSGQDTGTAGSCSRRSSRQKQNISYTEDQSDDDDFVSPKHKIPRTGSTIGDTNDPNCVNGQTGDSAASTGWTGSMGEGWPFSESLNAGASSKASASVDFSAEASSDDPEGYSYPDPEFYDFEEGRDESKFAVDQIWAVYDNSDAMPRYYALIRHVYGPKFKLRFNWLEYDPTSKAESLWYAEGLPIGCGTFRLGKAELTQERLMFSHVMPWRKGTKKNTYDILPRKGEVWAVFKNWDIEWSSCVDTDRHYEFEIVEVISDFTEGDVAIVVRLVKLQGFVSLFVQATDSGSSRLDIQMKDILRFSHNIPSYRLKGNEREGIPKGSLELDCASLPLNFADIFPSIGVDSVLGRADNLNNVCGDLHSKPAGSKDEVPTCTINKSSPELNGVADWSAEIEQTMHRDEVAMEEDAQDPSTSTAMKNSEQPASIPRCYEYPGSEFHDFEEERSTDKYEEGQIWALYSYVDKNPNFYGQISKVESERFTVHVTWLDGYSEQEHEQLWFEEQLPVGCGTFKLSQESITLDTIDTFSHLVHANPTAEKNHYAIHPNIGEIWAVYKNWSIGWSRSDHQKSDFDVVQVLDADSFGFEVLMLLKVKGYRAVFKAESGVLSRTMHIPYGDRLKFSHRIPFFRLTEEEGGKLRGYWELDPAAVPAPLLVTDST